MPRRNRNIPPQAVNIPLDSLPAEDEDEEIPIPNDEFLGTFVPPIAFPETFGAESEDLREMMDLESQTAEEATPAPARSFIGRIWGRLTNSPPYSTLDSNNIELSPNSPPQQEQGPRRHPPPPDPVEDETPEPPSPADSSGPRSTLGSIRMRIYSLFTASHSETPTTIPAATNQSERFRNFGTTVLELGKAFGHKVDDVWTRMAGASPRTAAPANDDLPDDPSCIQLLLVVGLMFPPLPFILGSLLFCTTPTNQRSLRKWGLLHVLATFLSIPYFIMSIMLAPEADYGSPTVFDRTINNEILAPHVPSPV